MGLARSTVYIAGFSSSAGIDLLIGDGFLVTGTYHTGATVLKLSDGSAKLCMHCTRNWRRGGRSQARRDLFRSRLSSGSSGSPQMITVKIFVILALVAFSRSTRRILSSSPTTPEYLSNHQTTAPEQSPAGRQCDRVDDRPKAGLCLTLKAASRNQMMWHDIQGGAR